MSEQTRKRHNRFKPRAEIEWLDHEQRKSHRNTIRIMTDLAVALERGDKLNADQSTMVQAITRSEARDTQLNTMWQYVEQTEASYQLKLAGMAPYDLTAYHELMNPHEPPAQHHVFVCEKLMAVERGDIGTLVIALPPGAAKALALDTPIPTPTGWTTMGEIKVGDQVFDENGKPCSVTWKSEVWKDRPVYEVQTDCGDVILADHDHEWLVRLCGKHPVEKIKETHQLARSRSKRPMITRAKALELPEASLPIDPYLLGVWLGDGSSSSVMITSGVADQTWLREELHRLGYQTSTRSVPTNFGVLGVRDAFVKMGLIHDPWHNTLGRKHIPQQYLRASIEQRISLLQGLVDTDGNVREDGYVTFCNTNLEIAEGVCELVRSLGVKTSLRENRATLYGKDCGPCYRVSFYHERAARMPRKAKLCRNQKRTPNTYIDVVPAGRQDTVCIEVDSPSHLFLCGKSMTPTHNSTYASRTFAQWTFGRNPDWRILACGHSQKFVEDEFSKPNRNAINSDLFRLAFPDVSLNPLEKGSSFWRLDGWRGSYACRGALAGASGLRAKLILADDLFKNAADAMSEVIRGNIWRWWSTDIMSRRLPGAPIVLVNTLWHSEDVPGKIKKMYEEDPTTVNGPFEFINIPAEAGATDEYLGRAPGEWLWCSDQQEDGFYSIQDYLTKRASMPPSMWSALYLGQPLDKFGDFISEDQFQRYDKPPMNRENKPVEWTKTVLSADLAAKGKERSDYSVLMVFRQHIDGTHYLVDVWRGKESLEQIIRKMSRMMRVWQVNYGIIEDSGMGAQILENYAGKTPAPLIPYVPAGKGSKDFRFDNACPWITSGRILFPKEAPWLADFINELVSFPNGTYDDQVDAFSQYTDNELKLKVGGSKKLRMGV